MSQMGLTVKPIIGKYLRVQQNGIGAKKGNSYGFFSSETPVEKFAALIGDWLLYVLQSHCLGVICLLNVLSS